MIFCGSKSFTKNHFQMEMFFLAQEIIISKTLVIIFCANHFQSLAKKEDTLSVGNDFLQVANDFHRILQVAAVQMIYCSRKSFLRTSKIISWLRWECRNNTQQLIFCKDFLTLRHGNFREILNEANFSCSTSKVTQTCLPASLPSGSREKGAHNLFHHIMFVHSVHLAVEPKPSDMFGSAFLVH